MSDLITSTSAAALAGVGVSSIKRWADEGKFQTVRTPGGHRRIVKAELLTFLNRNSSETTGIESKDSSSWTRRLLSKNAFEVQGDLLTIRGQLGSWSAAMDELGKGVQELGTSWADGTITIAQEHAATEKLGRVLAAIYDSQPMAQTDPICLLACAEGDMHTLGLSMLRIVLQEAGWKSIWLGSRTPLTELEILVDQEDVSMIALSASRSSASEKELRSQVEILSHLCDRTGIRLVVGGSGRWPMEMRSVDRFYDFESFVRSIKVTS